MSESASRPATAFRANQKLAAGPLAEVACAVRAALDAAPDMSVLVFDDATGAVVDLDLRGTDEEIVQRVRERGEPKVQPTAYDAAQHMADDAPRQKRGRPKLGVTAREVTLLPRHWEWLAAQPGGASNALRRLTETAMRADRGGAQARARTEAAYRFMSAMAGDLPGFEEASRALFAGDRTRFGHNADGWPPDIRAHVNRMAWENGDI
ncbi:DUF2239 family protein [Arvimicrobium flavum]|uniref:DUF2239 family protein n=1 Tax=Arvimicrobium flavum TaxID=3393320 RepID=UPI00237BE43B|nr:DUF2239 family protein [Mesorhizobium shangrilense]